MFVFGGYKILCPTTCLLSEFFVHPKPTLPIQQKNPSFPILKEGILLDTEFSLTGEVVVPLGWVLGVSPFEGLLVRVKQLGYHPKGTTSFPMINFLLPQNLKRKRDTRPVPIRDCSFCSSIFTFLPSTRKMSGCFHHNSHIQIYIYIYIHKICEI